MAGEARFHLIKQGRTLFVVEADEWTEPTVQTGEKRHEKIASFQSQERAKMRGDRMVSTARAQWAD